MQIQQAKHNSYKIAQKAFLFAYMDSPCQDSNVYV